MKHSVLSDDAASVFCLEVAEALKSGITVSESFLLISEQEKSGPLQKACLDVYERTDAGEELAASMAEQGIFPGHILKMLQVAEKTGTTEQVFRELSAYYKRKADLSRSVRSAVVYPLMLLVIILAVFFVFIIEVLPVFDNVFRQIGATMAPAAEFFMRMGLNLAKAKWVLLAVAVVLAAGVLAGFIVPPARRFFSELFSRLFHRTRTGKKALLSQVASVLSLSVAGTRDLEEALELSCGFSLDTPYEKPLRDCLEAVRNGERFADHAEKAQLFAPVYCRMIGIGEKTGSVDAMMSEVAGRAQADSEAAIQKVVGRVEPAAVIILSVCVGLLLLSVMLPLVGIMSAL